MKHPVDVHVGQRLRHRRWLAGMTQQQLAGAVGVKFQQIQKYESGANRISASRLYDLSTALDVDIAFFFEGLESKAQSEAHDRIDPDILANKEVAEFVRAYHGMEEGPRKRLFDLAKALFQSTERGDEAAV